MDISASVTGIDNSGHKFKYSRIVHSYFDAHKCIRNSLKSRIYRSKTLDTRSVVHIHIYDVSSACPEIIPGYYNKNILCSEYFGEQGL